MAFIKLLLVSYFVIARTSLLEFTAKQNVHNIKYFFKNNDSVFYTKGTKTLAFSSNYKAFEVLNEKSDSEFSISTFDNNLFLISSKNNHFKILQPNKNPKIYLYNLKKKKLDFVGLGANPKFHKKGKYISYYNFSKNQIIISRREILDKKMYIKINSTNQYFIPEIVISDDEQVFYTDHNDGMTIGILKYDLDLNKRSTLYKGDNLTTTIEICEKDDDLIILESSFNDKSFVNLYSLKTVENDISKRSFIYTSSQGPAHSLLCTKEKERIYFIKKVHGRVGPVDEVVSVNKTTKKAYIHSDLKFTTSLINIDGQLLIPYRTKFYTIRTAKNIYLINDEVKETDD